MDKLNHYKKDRSGSKFVHGKSVPHYKFKVRINRYNYADPHGASGHPSLIPDPVANRFIFLLLGETHIII